jgi:broad specificity phosphatase PhoE
MKIYLVRHGQTNANKDKIIQGRTDNPLNQTGIEQAKSVGKYFKDKGLVFDYCVSSPLIRAIHTSEIILETMALDKEIDIHQEIIERDFGALDGQKIMDHYFEKVHNGLIEDMEKDHEIEERVMKYFNGFFKKYNYDNVLIVAHSHVIKSLLVNLVDDFEYDTYLKNASIQILERDQDIKVLDYNITN